MLNFQQKWKTKTFLYSRPVRVVLVCIAIYSLFSVYRVYQNKLQSERDVASAQKELLQLSAKNITLVHEIDQLQTDEGLEAEIRNKYSVAKADEQVVVLVETGSGANSTTTQKSQTVWGTIKEFFGF